MDIFTGRGGGLRMLTALRKFEVLITPESPAQAEEPPHDPALRSDVDRTDD